MVLNARHFEIHFSELITSSNIQLFLLGIWISLQRTFYIAPEVIILILVTTILSLSLSLSLSLYIYIYISLTSPEVIILILVTSRLSLIPCLPDPFSPSLLPLSFRNNPPSFSLPVPSLALSPYLMLLHLGHEECSSSTSISVVKPDRDKEIAFQFKVNGNMGIIQR